jgi:hypothetical protein
MPTQTNARFSTHPPADSMHHCRSSRSSERDEMNVYAGGAENAAKTGYRFGAKKRIEDGGQDFNQDAAAAAILEPGRSK